MNNNKHSPSFVFFLASERSEDKPCGFANIESSSTEVHNAVKDCITVHELYDVLWEYNKIT